MPKAHSPRKGSMQFWPRVRAKRETARVRAWASPKDAKLAGFAGYKVGMVHVMVDDERPNSISKGKTISWPATIVECPPLTIFGIKFTKDNLSVSCINAEKLNKHLSKKITTPKKHKKLEEVKEDSYDDIKLIAHTNPGLTGIGKKKPEIFEIALGGKLADKLTAAKEMLGKEIKLSDVFAQGQIADIHAITKGKGFCGPVKRFGVAIRQRKSEKTKRGPGSLGGWKGHAHFMYRVAHAGQMGYHQRTEYNKQILSIDEKTDNINPKSGFKHYGVIKNNYLLFKGSIAGPSKRLIRFNHAIRPNRRDKVQDFNFKIIN